MLNLEIKRIDENHAELLNRLLSSSVPEYNQHFIPFEFDLKSVTEVLKGCIKDYFFGIFFKEELIGFYMLRGFDEGYEIPSYGVFINQKYSGNGLGRLTLDHAISLTKLLGKKKLMLKVHPENYVAKNLYLKNDFKVDGVDPKNSNLIMYKVLK